jgi:hypothetical protein
MTCTCARGVGVRVLLHLRLFTSVVVHDHMMGVQGCRPAALNDSSLIECCPSTAFTCVYAGMLASQQRTHLQHCSGKVQAWAAAATKMASQALQQQLLLRQVPLLLVMMMSCQRRTN